MDASKTSTLSFTDIDYSLLVYCLGALLVGMGGSYYIMKTERIVAAGGFFLASLAIFIFYGLRWFDGFKLRPFLSGKIDMNSPWPPVVNYCPDFLSLKKDSTGMYCVDTMGVTGLRRWTNNSAINVTDAVNAIKLDQNSTGQTYASAYGPLYGITWEGIYDGRSAVTTKPPYPAA